MRMGPVLGENISGFFMPCPDSWKPEGLNMVKDFHLLSSSATMVALLI